ncbi:LytR/AlgR family response regulator transcription factor [Aquimarina litoralis]|uniref:LytR/AlgR family response regulator transcription factor n=1 Tax=Aquimarina litoralis TaxID=584605 RepID=UPI001C598981|nr:LytTR family DNA-binding domain-containing protein [Aquimarina litoralis]MBW1298314.1 LytTR family transcriptional regulator [Aquimarina litoralis]
MKSILDRIKVYLGQPYPYLYSNQRKLLVLLLSISVLSFVFSYFFEPFDVNETEHKISSMLILVIHACIPFPIAYLYFSSLNKRIKDDTSWTLGKELFHLSVILLIIGIVGFLIRDIIYTNPDNWSFRYLWEEIRNTFLVGFLLLIIILPLNLERLIRQHTTSVKKLPIHSNLISEPTSITIQHTASDGAFELLLSEFLFAKVESNYTEVFTVSSGELHKTLIRITLKELEEQLKPVSNSVFKTHRSYLVQLQAIESISGNAQGYLLTLKNCPIKIPVSRSKIADFNTVYSQA